MAGRSDDSTAGVAGYVAVGLGHPGTGGLSPATWTWLFAVLALVFVIAVHFRIGFSAAG